MPLFAPRLPVDYFVSAFYVLVQPKELLRFHFKEVTPDYLAFKYIVMLLDFCHVLLVIVVSLVLL
jgi:hypothetical protein